MKRSALLFLLAALACEAQAPGVTDISQEEFVAAAPESSLILDVRSADEFASGHVPGAINIPVNELASRLGELRTSANQQVVVYCERGGRAGKAASVLLSAGISGVRHLDGDMSAWRAAALPIAKP